MRPRDLVFAAVLLAAAAARPACATPVQFVPVDDPIVAELRVLDLYAPAPGADSLAAGPRLPHLDAGPWQVLELARAALPGAPGSTAAAPAGPRGFAARRVLRALGRDGAAGAPADIASTPRALQYAWPGDERLEVSVGLEGTADLTRAGGATTHQWRDGSGVHVRTGLQVDRWLAYSHLYLGELRGVRAFSDALVANTDLAASTEESYLAYTAGTAWSAQIGRGHWQWGPGEEGTLMLSRSSAPVTGLMLHARIEPLRADAFVFSATVEPGRGEQLAAHRLEWQPWNGVRVAASEAARYQAGGWQGIYLAGVVPYAAAQRLLDQDHADTTGTLRNNVMVTLDASVRIADGSRVYGELLIDDLHARTSQNPNKYGGQAGWSGTGTVGGSRLTWNAEYTWLSRYVYTSYFGRSYTAQGGPMGFPTGPDARRFRTRVTWDPAVDWQLGAVVTRTDHGSEGLADPFIFGAPVPDVNSLAPPVEHTRTVDGQLRWWPASGVDLSVSAGRVWSTNAANVEGASTSAWRGALAFRLTR